MRLLLLLSVLFSACAPRSISGRLISQSEEARYYARYNELPKLEESQRTQLVRELAAAPSRLDRGQRIRTAEAIGYLENLRGDYVSVAAAELKKTGVAGVPLLMRLLAIPGPQHAGATFHPAVVEALAHIGGPAVPLIVAELQEEAKEHIVPKLMIEGGYAALSRIGAPAVPTLISILLGQTSIPGSADHAIFALAHMGPEPVPALARVLRTGSIGDRTAATWALSKIAEKFHEAHLPLIHALSDRDVEIRLSAVKGLGGAGSAAADAVPALKRLLKDTNGRVRDATLEALERIATPEAQGIVRTYKSSRTIRDMKKLKHVKPTKRPKRKVKSRIR